MRLAAVALQVKVTVSLILGVALVEVKSTQTSDCSGGRVGGGVSSVGVVGGFEGVVEQLFISVI